MPYTQKVADTLKKVVSSINAEMPGIVEQIILYGSYARGDYSAESDLDIMLLMKCSHTEIKQFQKAVCKIASRIGLEDDIEVSLMMQDKETFEKRLAILPFYRNVKKEGVMLYES